ncbi:hypothetical protein TL16_g12489 [Triparma laevis f. inornata]|uniref:G domain-containing protein n=1 Tax=Triparma laevis f. inornata TaxID=1714386 RepID=A0A9W7BM46_9STRA|nr:hypothetical protein TL16_g12489 [Triparma laevis f. inornata]
MYRLLRPTLRPALRFTSRLPAKKFEINPNWEREFNASALTLALDKMSGVDISQGASFGEDDRFDDEDMNERLMEAQSATGKGYVVPKNVDFDDELFFDPDADESEFDNFEPKILKPRNINDSTNCPGCGVKFQSDSTTTPGFLRPDKMLEVSRRVEFYKTSSTEWSVEDEVQSLILGHEIENIGGDPDPDLDPGNSKPIICQRCYDLDSKGTTLLSSSSSPSSSIPPSTFTKMLTKTLTPSVLSSSVILILVDLFDFNASDSALSYINNLIISSGSKAKVILGVNKSDLFPSDTITPLRAESYIRRELEIAGIECVKGQGSVKLLSGKTGFGVEALMGKINKELRMSSREKVYVVGGANVGKSTLLNRIISKREGKRIGRGSKKNKFSAELKSVGGVTESNVPGTTLGVIEIELSEGKKLYDTPGLIVEGSFLEYFKGEELKKVVPKKRVEPVTYRVEPGGSLMIGGVGRIDLHEDCKSFLITVFVSNEVKVHPCKTEKAEELLEKHFGGMLSPPVCEEGNRGERLNELREGGWEDHVFRIDGKGWKEAAADVTLLGLGWFSITGSGEAKVRRLRFLPFILSN